MVNDLRYPSRSAWARSMRTQAAWNVDTHMRSATGADEADQALAHLVGGLVGEGDGEDLPRGGVAGGDEMGDAVGEHPRLARPRPRHHQQRGAPVDDGAALGAVQALEQLVGLRGGRRSSAAVAAPAVAPPPAPVGSPPGGRILELVDAVEGTEPAETG